jgi:hypothetical protein
MVERYLASASTGGPLRGLRQEEYAEIRGASRANCWTASDDESETHHDSSRGEQSCLVQRENLGLGVRLRPSRNGCVYLSCFYPAALTNPVCLRERHSLARPISDVRAMNSTVEKNTQDGRL